MRDRSDDSSHQELCFKFSVTLLDMLQTVTLFDLDSRELSRCRNEILRAGVRRIGPSSVTILGFGIRTEPEQKI